MARETGKLKDKAVQKLIRDGIRGSHYDGRGLILKIKTHGTAAWESRYQLNGKVQYMGLGSTADLSLVEARKRNRKLVRLPLLDGIDPLVAKRAERAAQVAAAAKAMTFAQACDQFLEQHKQQGAWKSKKHEKQWSSTLTTYALPILGEMPVADIDVPLVLKVLEQPVAASLGHPAGRLWDTRQETAARLRGRLETVFDWCKARQLRTGDNPAAKSVIEQGGLKVTKVTEHHAALPYENVANFMTELRTREGSAARALEFLIYTAARTKETRLARWSQINWDEAAWDVPAENMKMKRPHRVPLSDAAIELLRNLPHEGDSNDGYIFIGAQANKPMGHSTIDRLLKKMVNVTVHGMRASFGTWGEEQTNYAEEIREAALAHSKEKTAAAYQRGDKFDKRRRLMRDWAKYCASGAAPRKATGNNVVGIGATR